MCKGLMKIDLCTNFVVRFFRGTANLLHTANEASRVKLAKLPVSFLLSLSFFFFFQSSITVSFKNALCLLLQWIFSTISPVSHFCLSRVNHVSSPHLPHLRFHSEQASAGLFRRWLLPLFCGSRYVSACQPVLCMEVDWLQSGERDRLISLRFRAVGLGFWSFYLTEMYKVASKHSAIVVTAGTHGSVAKIISVVKFEGRCNVSVFFFFFFFLSIDNQIYLMSWNASYYSAAFCRSHITWLSSSLQSTRGQGKLCRLLPIDKN